MGQYRERGRSAGTVVCENTRRTSEYKGTHGHILRPECGGHSQIVQMIKLTANSFELIRVPSTIHLPQRFSPGRGQQARSDLRLSAKLVVFPSDVVNALGITKDVCKTTSISTNHGFYPRTSKCSNIATWNSQATIRKETSLDFLKEDNRSNLKNSGWSWRRRCFHPTQTGF